MEAAVTLKATELNPYVGDLELDDTGDLVMRTSLASQAAQWITVALNFFRGEWPFDLDAGTPWYQHILGKGVNDRIIRSVLGGVVRACPYVAELQSLTYTVSKERRLSFDFRAKLRDGTIMRASEFAPFVVEP